MIALDTNVLVYAHREELPQHQLARQRLTELAEGAALWALPVFCLGEFLRVVTHPRIFAPPTDLAFATAILEDLLGSSSLKVLNPGPRYPALFLAALRAADTRGNLVFDAQIAALCQEHGVSRLLTLDRDFARFPNLEMVPLTEPLA